MRILRDQQNRQQETDCEREIEMQGQRREISDMERERARNIFTSIVKLEYLHIDGVAMLLKFNCCSLNESRNDICWIEEK